MIIRVTVFDDEVSEGALDWSEGKSAFLKEIETTVKENLEISLGFTVLSVTFEGVPE